MSQRTTPVCSLGDGKSRAGSNYDHDFPDAEPTESGKNAVLEKVGQLVKSDITGTSHRAAIRPIIRQSRAVIGRHPEFKNVAFFNGLGSKGVMNGPFVADQLAEHLVCGGKIDDEPDIRQNF